MKFERPFDMLNACRGKEVIIFLKDKRSEEGILESFDATINIVVSKKDEPLFIKGDNVLSIKPKNKLI